MSLLPAYAELTDSHCHLDEFARDPEMLAAVLERAFAAGVRRLLAIGIGDGPEEMDRALEIARRPRLEGSPEIFASAGIHPQEAHRATPEHLDRLGELARDPRCVAVGEIGLDYYHAANPEIAVQKAAFVAQMEVAAEVRRPILIHCRTSELARPEAKAKFGEADAWEDLLELLDRHWTPHGLGGVMHCFSGGVGEARRSLDAGFHISFAGNVTYPKSIGLREAAGFVPADRLLVETDAPFLAPVPCRGQTNEPALITHTAAVVAGVRGISAGELAELTSGNFTRLFPAAAAGL